MIGVDNLTSLSDCDSICEKFEESCEVVESNDRGGITLQQEVNHKQLDGVGNQNTCFQADSNTAHVTLGHSNQCSPVQASMDMANIILLENDVSLASQTVLDIGQVYHYGTGVYAISLDVPFTVETLFSGYY